jgi:hypothetical protein
VCVGARGGGGFTITLALRRRVEPARVDLPALDDDIVVLGNVKYVCRINLRGHIVKYETIIRWTGKSVDYKRAGRGACVARVTKSWNAFKSSGGASLNKSKLAEIK